MEESARTRVWKIAKTFPKRRNGFTFIYGLFDENGTPFYVGQTIKPRDRCKQHYHKRKTYFEMRILELVPNDKASAVEQHYIRKFTSQNHIENRAVFAERTWWQRLGYKLLERTEERLSG